MENVMNMPSRRHEIAEKATKKIVDLYGKLPGYLNSGLVYSIIYISLLEMTNDDLDRAYKVTQEQLKQIRGQ